MTIDWVIDAIWDRIDSDPYISILEGGSDWIDIDTEGDIYRITVERKATP